MDCQDFIRQLTELAGNGPDFELPHDLQQHHLQCHTCDEELNHYRAAWSLLPAALDQHSVTPQLEARVMERITAPAPNFAREESSTVFAKYSLAATVLIALTVATMLGPAWMRWRQHSPGELARVKELAEQMGKLDQLEKAFASPKVRYVSITSTTKQAQGYLVYDQIAGEGHFFGHDFNGRSNGTHVLWLVDARGGVLASVPIEVDANQVAAALIKLPTDLGQLSEVIVSFEPTDAHPSQPSADIRLRANVAFQ